MGNICLPREHKGRNAAALRPLVRAQTVAVGFMRLAIGLQAQQRAAAADGLAGTGLLGRPPGRHLTVRSGAVALAGGKLDEAYLVACLSVQSLQERQLLSDGSGTGNLDIPELFIAVPAIAMTLEIVLTVKRSANGLNLIGSLDRAVIKGLKSPWGYVHEIAQGKAVIAGAVGLIEIA